MIFAAKSIKHQASIFSLRHAWLLRVEFMVFTYLQLAYAWPRLFSIFSRCGLWSLVEGRVNAIILSKMGLRNWSLVGDKRWLLLGGYSYILYDVYMYCSCNPGRTIWSLQRGQSLLRAVINRSFTVTNLHVLWIHGNVYSNIHGGYLLNAIH